MKYTSPYYPGYPPSFVNKLAGIAGVPLVLLWGASEMLPDAVSMFRNPSGYFASRREQEQNRLRLRGEIEAEQDRRRPVMAAAKRSFLEEHTRPYQSIDEIGNGDIVLYMSGIDDTNIASIVAFKHNNHRDLPLDTQRSPKKHVLVVKNRGKVERIIGFDVGGFYEGILEMSGRIETEGGYANAPDRINQSFEALADRDVAQEDFFHRVTSTDLTARIGSFWEKR